MDVNRHFVQKDLYGLHPSEDGKRLQERIAAVKWEGRKDFSLPTLCLTWGEILILMLF